MDVCTPYRLACVWRAVCHRRTEREIEETVNAARGLWVGLQASVGRVRYLGNARTRLGDGGHVLSNVLNRIALTSQYAEYLENAPMEAWGWRGG